MSDDEKVKIPIKRHQNNSNSELDEIGLESSYSSSETDEDIKSILGYKCYHCKKIYTHHKKYKDHISMKNS
jgi:hypothetical protein